MGAFHLWIRPVSRPSHRIANNTWVWDDVICKDYTIEDVAYMHALLWASGQFIRVGLFPAGSMFVVDKFEEMYPGADVQSLRSLVTIEGYTRNWLSTTYGFVFP
jgi:hypothetical protein